MCDVLFFFLRKRDDVMLLSLVGGGGGERPGGLLHLRNEMISNKVTVIFCVKSICQEGTCYCCEGLPGSPCLPNLEDCRKICPVCDPHYHPPPAPAAKPATLPPVWRQIRLGSVDRIM